MVIFLIYIDFGVTKNYIIKNQFEIIFQYILSKNYYTWALSKTYRLK